MKFENNNNYDSREQKKPALKKQPYRFIELHRTDGTPFILNTSDISCVFIDAQEITNISLRSCPEPFPVNNSYEQIKKYLFSK